MDTDTLDDAINSAMGETPDAAPEDVVSDDPVVDDVPEAPYEVQEHIEKLTAPTAWSGFAKTKFDRLSPDIQKELSDYWGKVEAQQKIYDALDKTLGDTKQAVTATYGSVEGMVDHYLKLDKWAASDPVGLAKWFIQQHGITPERLFGQQVAPQNDSQEHYETADNALMQRLQVIEQYMQNQQQGSYETVQNQAASKIEEFSKNPEYPFFNDLKADMGRLMAAGIASSLEDAYQMAMRNNPKTFEHYMKAEMEKQAQKQTQEAKKSKAAATIRTSPSGKVATGRSDNLDDIIQEAMASRV